MEKTVSVRLKFKKSGPMKFIGHLDVMRYFQKLFRRAKIDIAYTAGFHPHQIMSFANPLGVGIESEGEYVDIAMNETPDLPSLISCLNAENVEGFEITGAAILPEGAEKGMAQVAGADYSIVFPKAETGEKSLDVSGFMSLPEIGIEKKTKKGVKTMDIKPGIFELREEEDGSLFMTLSAGSVLNIRPELVLKALFDHSGMELVPFTYQIIRLEQYGQREDGTFVSMLEASEQGES